MSETIAVLSSSSFIKVHVSNSQNNAVSFEKKFDKNVTIADLKAKLEIITGGSAATMQLEIYNGDKFVAKLDNDSVLLGACPIEDGYRIHVLDNFVFEQNVEKFELTENQYDNREDCLRTYLKKNKLGKYNEEEMQKLEEKKKEDAEAQAKLVALIKMGSRCKVQVKGNPSRIGTVMYNGELEGKTGIFIGVKFDEPLGVNDGTCNGKRYFTCEPKYGSFVVPTAVEVGDFPPETDGLDDDDEI